MAWIYSFAIIGSEKDNEWPGILSNMNSVSFALNQPSKDFKDSRLKKEDWQSDWRRVRSKPRKQSKGEVDQW